MFDGVPDQFNQFITPRTSLPLHLPFRPLHAFTTTTPDTFPTTFDPYNNHHPSHHHQLPLQPNLLHPLHHHKDEEKEENSSTISMTFEIERDHQRHQLPEPINDPWTNDEVLALLRIRSSMESWFPEFTWEHVSRKLAEVGYKRSAEKCKEKFEEESRYFNYGKNNNNYRFLSELEELYQGDDHNNQNPHQVGNETSTPSEGQQDKKNMDHALEEDSRNDDVVSVTKNKNDEVVVEKIANKERKRKRGDDRFEVFKGFCERVVQKMMAQQEEMHNKLIEDMLRRDEDKFTREEAWKKQEMEKMNKELEMMAREQAIAGDRQANVIEFLNKFSASSLSKPKVTLTPTHCSNSNSNSNPLQSQNPNPSAPEIDNSLQPTPSSAMILNHLNKSAENPSSIPSSSTSAPVPKNNPSSSLNSQNDQLETNSVVSKDDIGRRWPKDEVLALINLRCSSSLNNNNSEEKEGNNKAPLWERISQGMLELGYKRSAKRCKEKWENINKYFRKTKDANRKRSLDSRTCPYFHLLSNLYNQGKLVLQSERQEGHLNAPENPEQAPPYQKTQAESSQVGSAGNFTMQQQVHHGGEKTLMQVPSLDFDQF